MILQFYNLSIMTPYDPYVSLIIPMFWSDFGFMSHFQRSQRFRHFFYAHRRHIRSWTWDPRSQRHQVLVGSMVWNFFDLWRKTMKNWDENWMWYECDINVTWPIQKSWSFTKVLPQYLGISGLLIHVTHLGKSTSKRRNLWTEFLPDSEVSAMNCPSFRSWNWEKSVRIFKKLWEIWFGWNSHIIHR